LALIRDHLLRNLPIIAALITSLVVSYVARKTTGGTPDNAVALIGFSLGVALILALSYSRNTKLTKFQRVYSSAVLVFLVATSLWVVNAQIKATDARTIWGHYPEVTGQLVEFESMDSMSGVSARPELVHDVQQLATWLESNVPQYKQELDGDDLYIFPSAQWMYGALGVESVRGVTIWYHPELTFIGEDPDTGIIADTKPKYVVVAKYYGNHMRPVDRTAINFAVMPVLAEFLSNNYRIAADISGFIVLKWFDPE